MPQVRLITVGGTAYRL